MPYKSKAQMRYIQGVAHGMEPRKGGLTQEAAQKYVKHSEKQDTSKLPEKIHRYCDGGAIRGKTRGRVV